MRWFLRGQVDLKTALTLAASLIAVGSAVWGAAANMGAKDQRLSSLESKVERMEATLDRIEERLPPKSKR